MTISLKHFFDATIAHTSRSFEEENEFSLLMMDLVDSPKVTAQQLESPWECQGFL